MNKNNIWKLVIIILLVLFAIFKVTPVDQKLKPGIDLGGGVSLIYDIDIEGLEPGETKGLAQRMIPILRKRIDPANVANINMIPHGDTRIEIQLPLANKDTIEKRQVYRDALKELENENINLLKVRNVLSKEDVDIDAKIAEFAGDSEKRAEILKNWAEINAKRSSLQEQRDQINEKMAAILTKLEDAKLTGVENMAPIWNKLDSEAMAEEISRFANEDAENIKLINSYMDLFKQKAPIVNKLTNPETGLNAKYIEASSKLAELNLGQARVMDTLAIENVAERDEMIEAMIAAFPDREEKIKATVDAYEAYKEVGGRLDDPEDLKRMLKGAGVLEFRILPILGDGVVTNTAEIQAIVSDLKEKGPKQASTSKYVWLEIENPEEFGGNSDAGQAIIGTFGEKSYVLASNQKGEIMLHGTGKNAWKLKKASPTFDNRTGKPAVEFINDERASKLFFALTSANVNRPLCIILDDLAISAPILQAEQGISSQGIITGDFTQQEVQDMANKLNAGSFPARMSDVPISEKTIGATIGAENRDQGIEAGKYGLIAVAVFMIVYYLLAGIIAVIALCMNLLFILAMMVSFDATFTLPGIAGLILTIGMSVDANVLIFERIREELNRGGSLRSAITNGYQRAFRTIFDANITTFFVALILYMVASEEIKGFAIILMLGIASSMFTALFATRVIFDLLIDMNILKTKITMQSLIGKPNINWMSGRGAFLVISTTLVLGGLAIFILRNDPDNSKFDIEFTGGTSFTVEFKGDEAINEEWVRDRITEKGITAKVYRLGAEDEYTFEITTTETNNTTAEVTFKEAGKTADQVKSMITKASKNFTGKLYKLDVQAKEGADNTFIVSTSQVNKALVRNVLNDAFKDEASVSEPVVDEVVSNAVREAFAGYLKIREDLGVNIVSVDKIDESTVDLPDYIGGVKIVCELDKETTYQDIVDRFEDVRFKGDMKELTWYNYDILGKDMTRPADDETIKGFVYASVHPEAGLRQFSNDEIERFKENEKAKVLAAGSLETTLSRVTQIDPSVGKEAMYAALVAIILSLIAIVAYIWIRFGTANFGFAAITALVHDVCIVLGVITACYWVSTTKLGEILLIQDFKIDLAIIAAFLTIIGYSLNDTIVVFDRIRENRGKNPKLTKEMLNDSVNQTLSRTLLTSFTTFLVVLIMYIWGGPGLRGFTFAMLVGIIIGTYSSIAIAAPILLIGTDRKDRD